jgi:flagellar biosynthesis protein FlhF
MRVKRYVADTLQEAIARVKNDLGRNAIILHTKQFKDGGFLGFFAQRRFEVIAAVDENPTPILAKPEPVVPGKPLKPLEPEIPAPSSETMAPEPVAATVQPTVQEELPDAFHINRPVEPEKSSHLPATPVLAVQRATSTAADPGLKILREEIAEMKEMIRQVNRPPVIIREQTAESEPMWQLREKLATLGLEREIIDFLIGEIPAELWETPGGMRERLDYCRQLLEAKLMFSQPLATGLTSKQQVIALIGPTGVGKTTTIAKLAANFNLFERKKVGLITIDTYRIAAVEHLKTYGEIMNLPVEVVYTPADLAQAIANLADCDVILVDTAGRSPRNQMMMDELRKFITTDIQTVLLVISATTQYHDMINIEQKFSRIAYTHMVFTKLDETSCIGPIISLAWKCKRPISYLTVGQNVPDDIESAKPDKLIGQLFKGLSNG